MITIDTSISGQAYEARQCVNRIDELKSDHLAANILCPHLCETSNNLFFTAFWLEINSTHCPGHEGVVRRSGDFSKLIIVLAVLFSIIVATYLTIYRGIETKENRALYEKALKGSQEGLTQSIKAVYSKSLPFLKRQCINSYLKTGLSFTLTAGLVLLTTAAVMAYLHGHSYLVSPEFLALIGAGVVGAAVLGFIAKNITIYALSFTDKRLQETRELYESLNGLKDDVGNIKK